MRRMLSTLLGTAAVLSVAGMAQAQTWTFNAGPATGSTRGSWSVVLNQTVPGTWTVNVVANPGPPVPGNSVTLLPDDVYKVTLSFTPDTALATTLAGGVSNGYSWSTTSPIPGNSAGWTAPAPLNYGASALLHGNGSNSFFGTATTNGPVNFVTVSLDGVRGNRWDNTIAITPESSAVVQFLPALLPVGLVLRRKLARKKAA